MCTWFLITFDGTIERSMIQTSHYQDINVTS